MLWSHNNNKSGLSSDSYDIKYNMILKAVLQTEVIRVWWKDFESASPISVMSNATNHFKCIIPSNN